MSNEAQEEAILEGSGKVSVGQRGNEDEWKERGGQRRKGRTEREKEELPLGKLTGEDPNRGSELSSEPAGRWKLPSGPMSRAWD